MMKRLSYAWLPHSRTKDKKILELKTVRIAKKMMMNPNELARSNYFISKQIYAIYCILKKKKTIIYPKSFRMIYHFINIIRIKTIFNGRNARVLFSLIFLTLCRTIMYHYHYSFFVSVLLLLWLFSQKYQLGMITQHIKIIKHEVSLI